MTVALLVLKWIAGHWREVTIGAAVVALLWLVDDWRDRGRELTAWRQAAAGVSLERDQWRAAAAECTKATREARNQADAFELRLAAELEREPEFVTEYRDRVRLVESTIQSKECTEALHQAAEVLAGVTPP